MSAIPDQEIADARAEFATLLPDRCTIQRAVKASDGGGGQTTSWPDHATDVPCRLTATPPARGGQGTSQAGDRLNDITTHIVTFAADADVVQGDRILIAATTYETLLVGTGGTWELSRPVHVRPVA